MAVSHSERSLREDMPVVAAFIDDLREAFGRDAIDAQIRLGMAGHGTFWASENGIEVGSRPRNNNNRGVS